MSDLQPPRRTARFYTAARRIRVLVGKLPNGGRIWGGPYTILQIVAGSLAVVIGWQTRWIWGPAVGSPISQLVMLAIIAVAATWGSGRIPSTKRKVSDLVIDSITVVAAPASGAYQGRPIRLAPPHYVGGSVLLALEPDTASAAPALADSLRDAVAGTGITGEPASSVPVQRVMPELVPAAAVAAESPAALPDNVIPFPPRKSYATGLERLLDQARKETS